MSKPKRILESKYIVSFIFKFSLIVFIGFGIFGLFITIFLNKKIGPTYLESVSTLSQIQDHLPSIISITAIIQAVALCIIAMLLALLWSHGIAGPLVRFRRYIKDIPQGKLLKEPITFRTADQLHGLAQAFSEMIISHKNSSAKALSLLVEAQRILDECKAFKDQGKEFDLKLKKLKAIYLEIRDIYIVQTPGR